jgi:hypothetical protein
MSVELLVLGALLVLAAGLMFFGEVLPIVNFFLDWARGKQKHTKTPEERPVLKGGRIGSRCPFCHDEFADAEVVACAACTAKHHESCWDEHSECAACGNPERFSNVEHTGGRAGSPEAPGRLKDQA